MVYTREEIQDRVAEMAEEITQAYGPEDKLLVLGLLKGSFIFLADLVRQIQHPLQVDFLVASSYGNDTKTSGEVNLLYDPEASVEGRSVILVEDIIDSGTTMNRLIPLLEGRGPGAWRSAPSSINAWRRWTGSPGGWASMLLWSSWWGMASTTVKTSAISRSSGACRVRHLSGVGGGKKRRNG